MGALRYILLSGTLGVAGQLIMKQAMLGYKPDLLGPGDLVAAGVLLLLNPMVILGLAVYVSGTFFWLIALSRVDLSYAYPFASLNYILILLASWVLLGEQPSLARIGGVVAISVGVWAISRTTARTVIPPVDVERTPREVVGGHD